MVTYVCCGWRIKIENRSKTKKSLRRGLNPKSSLKFWLGFFYITYDLGTKFCQDDLQWHSLNKLSVEQCMPYCTLIVLTLLRYQMLSINLHLTWYQHLVDHKNHSSQFFFTRKTVDIPDYGEDQRLRLQIKNHLLIRCFAQKIKDLITKLQHQQM